MTEWADIKRRAEAATGADRELDADVARLLGWTFHKMKGDQRPYWREPGVTAYYDRSPLPAYTSSVNTALALIAERLPGMSAAIDPIFFVDGERVVWEGFVLRPNWSRWRPTENDWIDKFAARSATPALALVAAFAAAMDAQVQEDGR